MPKEQEEKDVRIILQQPAALHIGKTDAAAAGASSERTGYLYHECRRVEKPGNYTELVDCVVSSMQMEHLKKR